MKKSYYRVAVFALAMIIIAVGGISSVGAVPGITDILNSYEFIEEGKYYDIMEEYLQQYFEDKKPEFNMNIAFESSPDYAIVHVFSSATVTTVFDKIDEYYIYSFDAPHLRTSQTFYVIDLKTEKVTPLLDALESSKDEYMPFITDSGYKQIIRIGDVDRNNVLNVKDATIIQKCLAGLKDLDLDYDDLLTGFSVKQHGKWERYVSDFNCDSERNIKDATAIQKYIAGIE